MLHAKGFGVVINSPTQQGSETCELDRLSFDDIENDEVYFNGGGSCISGDESWEQTFRASPRVGRALVAEHGSARREGYSSDTLLYRTEKDLVLNNQDLWLGNGVELSFSDGASILARGSVKISGSSARPGVLTGFDWGGIVAEDGAVLYIAIIRIDDESQPQGSETGEAAPDQKASITVAAGASLETYDIHVTRHRGTGIKAEDGAELEIGWTSILVYDGPAASVGWPAILGFGANNEFGHYSGHPTSAVLLDTELDTSQLDLRLPERTNFRIRDLAFRTLQLGAGAGLQIESDGVIEIGEGGIHSLGRPELPVLIGGVDRDGRWNGLRLVGQSSDNDVLHTVFRNGGNEGTPVLSIATGNTVDVTGTAYVDNNGPGLHVESGAVVSGCSTLTFEVHNGDHITGAPCVD